MKRYLYFLPVLLGSFFLAGCSLPPQLSHFSPSQGSNKTQISDNLTASPQTSDLMQESCDNESCSLENQQTVNTSFQKSAEDTIKEFFNLINEGQFFQAGEMLSSNVASDEKSKKIWVENFSSFESADIIQLEPYNPSSWTQDSQQYLVIVDIKTNDKGANFGWDNGENTRFIEVIKDPQSEGWKINSLATGP